MILLGLEHCDTSQVVVLTHSFPSFPFSKPPISMSKLSRFPSLWRSTLLSYYFFIQKTLVLFFYAYLLYIFLFLFLCVIFFVKYIGLIYFFRGSFRYYFKGDFSFMLIFFYSSYFYFVSFFSLNLKLHLMT
jgi:hypothetical protein